MPLKHKINPMFDFLMVVRRKKIEYLLQIHFGLSIRTNSIIDIKSMEVYMIFHTNIFKHHGAM